MVSILLIMSLFVFLVLILSDLISLKMLLLHRKYVFFVLLLISTIISPPDIISQCILTVFLFMLFELTLFIVLITKLKAYSLIG